MLTLMRKHLHGWIAWIFLTCIAVVFIFWGAVGFRLDKGTYIDVGGEKVFPQQIEAFKQVFQGSNLVQVTLGIKQLKDSGFVISDEQLDVMIQDMPYFQIAGKFSEELYKRSLDSNPNQLQMIRKGVYYSSLVKQMTSGLQMSQSQFPSINNQYFKLMDQKRTLSAVTVDNDKFLADIKVTDDELQNYYNKSKSRYTDPAKVKLQYIKLSYSDIESKIKLSEQDIKDYYASNLEQFTTQERKKVAQIVIDKQTTDNNKLLELKTRLEKLDNTKPKEFIKKFSELAKEYSDDFLTAKNGGDLGWLQSGDLNNPVLDKVINELSVDKKLSKVISNDNKDYIFYLVEYKPSKQESLENVKLDVENRLKAERANNIYMDLKDQLERKSFEIADSLDLVAEDLNLKVAKTEQWLSQSTSTTTTTTTDQNDFESELFSNPQVVSAAFSDDVLENRNNSSAIDLGPEQVVVVRVIDYKPKRIKDYTEVESDITKQYKQLQARRKARDLAKKLWKEFTDNTANFKSLEALSKKKDSNKFINYQKPAEYSYLDTFWADYESSNNKKYTREELIQAFELPRPSKDYPVQAALLNLRNGDQAILAINSVTFGDYANASDEQKDKITAQVKYFTLMRDTANFFTRLQQDAAAKSYL